MTRLILVIVGACVLLFGIEKYIQFLNRLHTQPSESKLEDAKGLYSLRFIATFDCVSDDFENTPGLKVSLGNTVFLEKEHLDSKTFALCQLENIKNGSNEILITIVPGIQSGQTGGAFDLGLDDSKDARSIAEAIHVEIVRDETVINRTTHWIQSNDPITVSILFDSRDVSSHSLESNQH